MFSQYLMCLVSMVTFDMALVAVPGPEDFVTGLTGAQQLLCVQVHVVFKHDEVLEDFATVLAGVSLARVRLLVLSEEAGRQEDSGTVLTAVDFTPRVHTQVKPQLQQHGKRLSTFDTREDLTHCYRVWRTVDHIVVV